MPPPRYSCQPYRAAFGRKVRCPRLLSLTLQSFSRRYQSWPADSEPEGGLEASQPASGENSTIQIDGIVIGGSSMMR